MLCLSPQTLGLIGRPRMTGLLDDLAAFIEGHFVGHARLLGPEGCARYAELAILRASRYQLESRRDVFMYLTVMLVLGSHFDEDPLLPWAAQILNTPSHQPRWAYIDRLLEESLAYAERVAGSSNLKIDRMFLRLKALLEKFLAAPNTKAPWEEIPAEEFCRALFPSRYREVDSALWAATFQGCQQMAYTYGMRTMSELGFYRMVVFLLGPLFDRDPVASRLVQQLSLGTNLSPAVRLERLSREALLGLSSFLSYSSPSSVVDTAESVV